jgi:hypothetical protein
MASQAYIKKPFHLGGGASSGFSGEDGSGTPSGGSGFSGHDGEVVNGNSGFSGSIQAEFLSLLRAYVYLAEARTDESAKPPPSSPFPMPFPPPPPYVIPTYLPPSSQLNIALEGGHKYAVRGIFLVDMVPYPEGFLMYGSPVASSWHYTGAAANFAIKNLQPGLHGGMNPWWLQLDHIYPDATPEGSWILNFSDPIGIVKIGGTIETVTDGILSFNWFPFGAYSRGEWCVAYIKRGSYMEADKIESSNTVYSGLSGFSGKRGVVRIPTWMGL